MKRKARVIVLTVLGALVGLAVLLLFGGRLFTIMGGQPFCIQGDFPKIKFVSCGRPESVEAMVTPIPLDAPSGQAAMPMIFDDDGSPDGVTALMYFLRDPRYAVRAVTVSVGEAHPRVFAEHLARLLAGLGRADIPVGYGRETPLQGSNAFPEPWRQASDNFWGIELKKRFTRRQSRRLT